MNVRRKWEQERAEQEDDHEDKSPRDPDGRWAVGRLKDVSDCRESTAQFKWLGMCYTTIGVQVGTTTVSFSALSYLNKYPCT